MNKRRIVHVVVLGAVVLGIFAGLTVRESPAALTGQGWVNMRSLDPERYAAAWGYYSDSTWMGKYYDTRFFYYQSKYYDFFAPIYTKTTATSPWVLYSRGRDELKWQAYWLASKPQGDDAMLDAVNKVSRTYQGRVRVFLTYGPDAGAKDVYGVFSYQWSSGAINAYSIMLNTEYLTAMWKPSVYNVNYVAWMGTTLCHETFHQQFALTTHYFKLYDDKKRTGQLHSYETALNEGLAHYAGAMAYRWVPQAIASRVGGYFATSYSDLRAEMISASGYWYNWPSLGYRYNFGSDDRDRWQLVAVGYYLARWKVGQSGWYEGKAVNMFLTRTATEIDARGASFTWINSVQPVYGFSSMRAIQYSAPDSYRGFWEIMGYRYRNIIPD